MGEVGRTRGTFGKAWPKLAKWRRLNIPPRSLSEIGLGATFAQAWGDVGVLPEAMRMTSIFELLAPAPAAIRKHRASLGIIQQSAGMASEQRCQTITCGIRWAPALPHFRAICPEICPQRNRPERRKFDQVCAGVGKISPGRADSTEFVQNQANSNQIPGGLGLILAGPRLGRARPTLGRVRPIWFRPCKGSVDQLQTAFVAVPAAFPRAPKLCM